MAFEVFLLAYFSFSAFFVYHLHIALREIKVCEELKRQGLIKPEWKPFLRPSSATLPCHPAILYLVTLIFGPLRFFALLIFIASSATISSLIAPTKTQATYKVFAKVYNCIIWQTIRFHGEILPSTACLVANHPSGFDDHVLWQLPVEISWVAKSALQFIPFVSQMLRQVGTIFIQRETEEGRQRGVKDIHNFLTSWKPGKKRLMIFPEGTCNNGEYLLPFKETAFQCNVDIQPVVVKFSSPLFSFTVDSSYITHIVMLTSIPFSSVDVYFLPPVKDAQSARNAILKVGQFKDGSEGSYRAWKEFSTFFKSQ
jgi:1-acyl-sn-glycerol-3-phosphate acyltransferase